MTARLPPRQEALGTRDQAVPPSVDRARVLLVDDHEPNLVALEALLERLPAEAVRARSGVEALERLGEGEYAAVLLDVQMPGLDGFDTLERLRRRDGATPVLFVTAGAAEPGRVRRAYELGAVDFLAKPLDPDALRAKVRVFLELARARDEARVRAKADAERERLALSEARYRSFVEATSQTIWVTDADGEVVEDSPSWRAFTGQSYEAWVGRGWLDALHPDDRERAGEAWARAVREGGPYEIEYRVRRYDGDYRLTRARGAPVRDASGRVREWVGVNVDVTEQRLAEVERVRSGARLRAFVDNAPLGVVEWDADFRIRSWSPGAEAMFGWSAVEALGRRPDELGLVPPSDESSVAAEFERLQGGGADGAVHRNRNRTKAGALLDVEWYNATLGGAAGGDGAVLSFALDVTARVRAEKALAAALERAEGERSRFYDLLRDAPAIINVFRGPDHVFDFVNARFCELLPASPTFLGKTVREAQPELAGTGLYERLDEVYRTGEPFVAAEALVPVDRGGGVEERYFTFTYRPVRDAAGRVDGVASFAFDVTEPVRGRKAVEELARREEGARRVAEDANRMKDEFLATVSHELRTPLNAMLGWASMLQGGSLDAPTRARALATIERNARAQARLIDDLLDVSRILQGKFVLSVGPVELVRVVNAALDAVRPAAEAKGIRLQPVLDSHAAIVGDADRLQQVVWNLLSNAIKFTPKGGRVQVALRRAHSHVELSVADTGQGIEPDFLPHVFEPFRQADGSTARRSGGLGLGLSIVRSLVELHGGTVAARSDGPSLGATFVVRLPMAPLRADRVAPGPEPADEGPEQATFDCPPALAGLRVLVVDDERDTRSLLEFVLEQCDARVTTAASAAEALEALAAGRFDLLVSDVGMPGEDGLSLIRRVRELPPEANGRIPAVALTAYARGEDRVRALRAGFSSHLAKPIEPNELLLVAAALTTQGGRA